MSDPSVQSDVTPQLPESGTPHQRKDQNTTGLFSDGAIVRSALVESARKLNPKVQARNPVIFLVLVGAALTTVFFFTGLSQSSAAQNAFALLVAVILWLTVLFANFAEAIAEGRGKAQADALRQTRSQTTARVRKPDNTHEEIAAVDLSAGDHCVVEVGETIPGDGEVIEGVASVDESAITGESAPVIREAGGDRSAVTGGTKVLSDRLVIRITAQPGQTFLDRMIALVEGAERRKTPNEIALNILLAALTIIFLLVVVTLQPVAIYSGAEQNVIVLIALLVCLIPTTIGGLLSAIGIAGMDRMVQHNVLAMSGRAVEAAGDVTTLLLDKTGTVTIGDRHATQLLPVSGVAETDLARAAVLASAGDQTPEGRSILTFAKREHGIDEGPSRSSTMIEFSANTRMSGSDDGDIQLRKGAVDAVVAWARDQGGTTPPELDGIAERISADGGTPLAVARRDADGVRILGAVQLSDVVKDGMKERFDKLRSMGIRTVMVTGDNHRTAAAIAQEAGVDDFLAEATPEDKLEYIRARQAGGGLVAMTGDGTNDAPALAQADVGVAMNSGTQAAKEAGNMVDLDSDPTKLIEVVTIGKQLLITRGALTTFSIANDVGKYFAIIPAMFAGALPALDALNIMALSSPRSAILAAVIFNALIIIALVPLALRGVQMRARSATAVLRRNLLIYGLGGLLVPFIGIKLIDLLLTTLGVS